MNQVKRTLKVHPDGAQDVFPLTFSQECSMYTAGINVWGGSFLAVNHHNCKNWVSSILAHNLSLIFHGDGEKKRMFFFSPKLCVRMNGTQFFMIMMVYSQKWPTPNINTGSVPVPNYQPSKSLCFNFSSFIAKFFDFSAIYLHRWSLLDQGCLNWGKLGGQNPPYFCWNSNKMFSYYSSL